VVKLFTGASWPDEALVVPEVQIGLGAVLGHEHLAVLERRHRARIDVDVRIELEQGDARPRDSRIAAREAAAMPFPREETTPPVTKTYFVMAGTARHRC
jgi:hypothetical protein